MTNELTSEPTPFEVHESGRFLHGTKADLKVGDLLVPGRRSNHGAVRTANHVYVTATLMPQPGERSLRWVMAAAGSTLWSRRACLRTIPT